MKKNVNHNYISPKKFGVFFIDGICCCLKEKLFTKKQNLSKKKEKKPAFRVYAKNIFLTYGNFYFDFTNEPTLELC